MKYFIKCLVIYLVTIGMVHGNLPPTTLKGQAETAKPTTFNFEVPYNQATTTAAGTRLIETGNNNVIKDAGFEGNSLQWVTYADAAGTSPVDGTGGTANVTVAYTTTNPLNGKKSMLFTKDAANRQGQGTSINFTIPDINKGKVNNIKISYDIVSGTYATGDLTMWVINVDPASASNGRVIQPSAYTIEKSGLKESKFLEFQSDIDSSLYRLVIHVTSTSASAYSLRFDDVSVGLGKKIYGSVATDWISYTPTGTWIANSTYTGRWRRIGDSAEFEVNIALSGAPTATQLIINMPFGWTIDTSKISLTGSLGIGTATDTGVFGYSVRVGGYTSTQVSVAVANTAAAYPQMNSVTSTVPFSFGSNDYVTVSFKVPIQGWSSSQQLSNDADTRVVNFVGYVSSTQALTASVTNINLVTEKDSHGAWSGSTYVIPVAGDYFFTSGLTATANQTLGVEVYVNSVFAARVGIFNTSQTSSGAVIVPSLKSGDVVSFRASGNMTTNIGSQYKMTISRISGPSQIAASETVSARYTQSSAQSIPTSSATVVDFNTKVYDSHNAVTTGSSWRFTAPISGEYSISSTILFASSAWPVQRYSVIYLRKNGVNYAATPDVVTQVAQTMYFGPYPLSAKIKLLQGEYVDITIEQNRGSATSLHNASMNNWVEINRVGNY